MKTYLDLKDFFSKRDFKLIMAADAQTRIFMRKKDKLVLKIPAGGVSVALDPIAKASEAVYIARGKTTEKNFLRNKNETVIKDDNGKYTLKRLFLEDEELDAYYNGFSNQTLWPLCHVAFEPPIFQNDWYEGYKKVNQKFAKVIREEIDGKTFIWIHDYQLALVPKFLSRPKDCTLGMFWHTPWPTWEIFRILPEKKEILESLLTCDFLAFHRGYHVRNFLETVRRELEARIDEETNTIYYNKQTTTVKNLPLGVDTDIIKSLLFREQEETFFGQVVTGVLGNLIKSPQKPSELSDFFKNKKIILGVDRLDYTKGFGLRLRAIDKFLEENPEYIGSIVYVGILAPSRESVPAYKKLKKEIKELAQKINNKYKRKNWQPIHLVHQVFAREEIINFYKKANVCLVTPLDDGMNLVSKEFVIAASGALNPGMIVLSQFAGSAIDLTQALIVNPYNTEEVAQAIKKALKMEKEEKQRRIKEMVENLEENNVYEWAEEFIRSAMVSSNGLP